MTKILRVCGNLPTHEYGADSDDEAGKGGGKGKGRRNQGQGLPMSRESFFMIIDVLPEYVRRYGGSDADDDGRPLSRWRLNDRKENLWELAIGGNLGLTRSVITHAELLSMLVYDAGGYFAKPRFDVLVLPPEYYVSGMTTKAFTRSCP